MQYNTLYKRNVNGSINQWTVFVEGNTYWVEYGQVGGIITKGEIIETKGKNVGKKNETTAEKQALNEAFSLWKIKKKSNNCVENIEDVDKLVFNPPMLAKVYDKKYTEDIKFIQPKLDGIRCNTHFNGNIVEAISRRNNPFYSTRHIQGALKELLSKYPTIHLDGELYNHELHNDFNKIVSIVKKEKLNSEDINNCLKYVRYSVYDMWDDERPTMTFSERSEWIKSHLKGIEFIDIVPTFEIHSQEEIDYNFRTFIKDGYEGAIIRKDAPYEHKRSKHLLKYKEFMDDEFPILDICEGKKKGQAEYCWIDLKNGETCKATLAFSDNECISILNEKEKYIGNLATVRFFGWTEDKRLRFPVVKIMNRDYE